MRLLAAYIKTKIKSAAAAAFFCVIFAAVFALYALPVQAVGYAVLVCAFFGVFFFISGFISFRQRHIRLLELLEEITVTANHLPPPVGQLEADYQAIISTLFEEKNAIAGEMNERYCDLVEYFTIWAHQIKTPISAMHLRLQSEDTAASRELNNELQRIEQYVEMVLCYLRLNSDTTDFVIRTYDLDGIVRQAVRKYASQFIQKKIRLQYEPETCLVLTDEKWLLFVVEQVLSNAVKYTRTGSVTITFEAPKTLCIRDTGIGIAPEDLPRVCEKGFTGYNGRTDKRATGIGLYLCKQILLKLGHTITLESEPGQGTTVKIGLESADLGVE